MKLLETKTYGLTHIAVAVIDIERTLKFYTHVFEMEIMYREKDMIQLTTPGCNDILVFERKINVQAGEHGGIEHFGFRLRDPHDIEEMKKRVIEAGGTIADEGEFVPGSPYIFFKDPDGYTVEVWYELLK